MRILCFAGSLRTDSSNKRLAREAIGLLNGHSLGVHVFPQMMSLPNAHSAFDDHGRLGDESRKKLHALLGTFANHLTNGATLKAA